MMRLALALSICTLALPARADVEYTVDLARRLEHRADVEMTVRSAPAPLDLWMPVWTPGAYELRTWGRNLRPISASDSQGRPLTLKRTGPSTFRVEGHGAGAEVKLRYQVHAALLSDDGTSLDQTHAYLNGTSLFLAARGAEKTLHTVRVNLPEGWRLATALAETPAGDHEALGYEALIDAPIDAGRFATAEVRAAGRVYQVAIDGINDVPQSLLRDVAAIAEAESRIAGPPPYKRYVLLVHLADGIGRIAALEHAASATLVVPHRSLGGGDAYDELLYVIAHEMFHAWNARRLRPAELVPYDLSRPQPARSLWITEGLTEFYAHRAMYLCGKWSRARYLDRLGEEATRALRSAARGTTVEDDAEGAWHAADEIAGDPDAYYARGHLAALGLDATIRAATDGKHALDDVLRTLLDSADRQGGVLALDGASLARAIVPLAGEGAAAAVAQLTRTPGEPEKVAAALARIGVTLSFEKDVPRTQVGLAVEPDGNALRVALVAPGSPAAISGFRAGDRIIQIDGASAVRKAFDALPTRQPGSVISFEAVRATRRMMIPLRLTAVIPMIAHLKEASVAPKITSLRESFFKR
jgi:predicted metalloprotease with PDZ domain